MHSDSILKFRNNLANQGIEVTPSQAENLAREVDGIMENIIQRNYSEFAFLTNLNKEERSEVKEILSIKDDEDLDRLIDLIVQVRDGK